MAHHGFELDRLDPEKAHGDAVRRELGLDGQTVLTAIGRAYWIKNQEALVRAFARVAPAAPEATLVLAGPGDTGSLRALGQSLGVGDRLRCLGPRADVVDLLAATDLFVHPARAESFAMVIVEAMAMACPVVATPVGIAPEVVVDGRTGILSESAEPEGTGTRARASPGCPGSLGRHGCGRSPVRRSLPGGRDGPALRGPVRAASRRPVSRPRALLKSAAKGLRDWRPVNAVATTTVRAASGAPERPPEFAVMHLPRVGPVRSRLPNGATLRLWSKGDDFVSNQVFWRGWSGYEPETSPLFYALAETARTTLDLGAHVGFYSLLAALANPQRKGVRLRAVEGRATSGFAATFASMRLDNVTCVDAAVSDRNGTAPLLEPLVHIPCSAGLSEEQMSWHDELRKREVRTVTLDSFLKERQVGSVDLVKLDIEGTEAQALRGMAVTLQKRSAEHRCARSCQATSAGRSWRRCCVRWATASIT